jgi:hypothetical protein
MMMIIIMMEASLSKKESEQAERRKVATLNIIQIRSKIERKKEFNKSSSFFSLQCIRSLISLLFSPQKDCSSVSKLLFFFLYLSLSLSVVQFVLAFPFIPLLLFSFHSRTCKGEQKIVTPPLSSQQQP